MLNEKRRTEKRTDYHWGRLHRVVIPYLLGGPFNVPPAGGAFPDPLRGSPGIPTGGAWGTVDIGINGNISSNARATTPEDFAYNAGAAARFIFEFGSSGPCSVAALGGDR